ncbi:MAG: glycogen/starch synthase [Saprospiraceae bacterium]|nr:glycogen/starch synthase [Candidatus Brachybacter algidus]
MSKKKVLIIAEELSPYTFENDIANLVGKLPQAIHESGMEVRILMPKFGIINERRHRLHEVVRLSGMNIIIDDDDYPLIIKVASLPGMRLQVYFLDNEEFFKRKFMFHDEEGKPFVDNEDRMVFFCKGVIETIRKFGWPAYYIHCFGWMTALIPFYLKTAYKNDPILNKFKIIYTPYKEDISGFFTPKFLDKASINNLEPEDLKPFMKNKDVTLIEGALAFTDGIIIGSEDLDESVTKAIKKLKGIPVLDYVPLENMKKEYMEFYNKLIEE